MAAPCVTRHLGQICQSLLRSSIPRQSCINSQWILSVSKTAQQSSCTVFHGRSFHTSLPRQDLMEFFDEEKNWKETEIRCGRPWKKAELRLKSNEDIHKLWYVLLKERNMVMTMHEEYNRNFELFPHPQRLEKVEESMENIMDVVDERNRAYHLLETGQTGEPEVYKSINVLGLPYWKRPIEHYIPAPMNSHLRRKMRLLGPWVNHYLRLHREKEAKKEWRNNKRRQRFKQYMLKEFPDLKPEVIDEVMFTPKKPFYESDEK